MQCPNCDEKMEAVSNGDITAHRCFYCEGTWLSDNAFRAIKIDPGYRDVIEDLLKISKQPSEKPANRKCPECPGIKLQVIYNERLELDRCPNCEGTFFDKGELKGKAAIFGENQNQSAADYLVMEGAFWAVIALFGN